MPAIVPIVEGDGDVIAVPLLVARILQFLEYWDWTVGTPKKCGGVRSLQSKLHNFLQYAQSEVDCAAILILLDLDDGCPLEVARALVNQIKTLHLVRPVAVVLAHREYEAWFLASMETIAGSYGIPDNTTYNGDVELRRGAKEWLSRHMPPGKAYKETVHQAKMTSRLDISIAKTNSRSFRRLFHAIEELFESASNNLQDTITPRL